MIHSIFILNSSGQVIIEKHYRGNASRTETVSFWSQTTKSAKGVPLDVPPFLPTPKGALVHLQRNGLFLLASVLSDTHPVFVTQFLSSLVEVFEDYFGELNEHAIKDNFITVYELLDEMLDNGYPLTLESNTLKELIIPPSMLNRVLDSLGADSQKKLTSAAPLIPWRRSDVKYAQNEIFVDIIETINATFSASKRNMTHLAVNGVVVVNSRLSGVPDVNMCIRSRATLDDIAFHHCVRTQRYFESGVLTFVPPDGPFSLMSFVVRDTPNLSLPVDARARVVPDESSASASVSVSLLPRFTPPQTASSGASSASAAGSMVLASVMNAAGGKSLSFQEPESLMDHVVARIPFGTDVLGASLSGNVGTTQFDTSTGVCTWNIGVVARGKTPTLSGTISVKDGALSAVTTPQILLSFSIPGLSIVGATVDSLELGSSEQYNYYKGLRCITKAGVYEVRP